MLFTELKFKKVSAIYAPMIYTAPCEYCTGGVEEQCGNVILSHCPHPSQCSKVFLPHCSTPPPPHPPPIQNLLEIKRKL